MRTDDQLTKQLHRAARRYADAQADFYAAIRARYEREVWGYGRIADEIASAVGPDSRASITRARVQQIVGEKP